MKRKSQCDRVLEFIQEHGGITDNDAHDKLGVNRLSGRVFDLRKRGFDIEMVWKQSKNRYGEMTRYGVYRLRKDVAE